LFMAGAACCLLATGYWAGTGAQHGDSPPQSPAAAPESQSTARETPTPDTPGPEELETLKLRRRILMLERELDAARAAASSGRTAPVVISPLAAAAEEEQTAEGRPLGFPSDAEEPYTPHGFEKVALRAARECGMALDVVALDCSEFPCIAWTEATDPGIKTFSMSECEPWGEAFRHGTVAVGAVQRREGDTERRYFSWMALPPDPADVRAALRRARERNQGMKVALGILPASEVAPGNEVKVRLP
jgi:hypothetical protein